MSTSILILGPQTRFLSSVTRRGCRRPTPPPEFEGPSQRLLSLSSHSDLHSVLVKF